MKTFVFSWFLVPLDTYMNAVSGAISRYALRVKFEVYFGEDPKMVLQNGAEIVFDPSRYVSNLETSQN